jgi:hypothetical protein
LKSVTTDPSATGEQVHEVGSLLARVRAFDPRRTRPIEVAPEKNDLTKKKDPPGDPDYGRKLMEEIYARI